ncbi:trehalose-6-phosphate synthase, partial [Candidatus Roizmanbacteria bacterium CG01_land_8_20_14_3_00_33_9]
MAFKNSLEQYIKKNLKNRVFIVSSNREPYSHTHTANGIKIIEAVGGVHNLLNLIAQVSNGIYVAHGSGDADKEVVDKYNRIKLTTDGKSYTLKRIFLSKKEIDKYYYGFANQTLWPLCHAVFVKPIFDQSWWEMYKIVNRKFTDAILEEIGEKKAFVWLNDYHLALVPQMLR